LSNQEIYHFVGEIAGRAELVAVAVAVHLVWSVAMGPVVSLRRGKCG
jgi:hypothetical protein